MNKSLTIASTKEGVNLVEQEIDTFFNEKKLDELTYGNVLIAVSEGVLNAIYHGNKEDESKKVTINFKWEKETLEVSISDEGKGFDPEKIPDPTKPENLEKLDGRGIFMMHSLSDDVTFENNGAKVILSFELNPESSLKKHA